MSEQCIKVKAPRWAWILGTGFGSGCLRPAPGTWGSLAALLAWAGYTFLAITPFCTWSMQHLQHPHVWWYRQLMELAFLVPIVVIAVLGTRACTHIIQETGIEDPGFAVVDEWLGMWVTLWPIRWDLALSGGALLGPGRLRYILMLALPFVIFRILDIAKPWPVYQIQDLPEGQGVMADDLIAGLYGIPLVMLLAPMLMRLFS
jgi:phosphatidylglycerophosphatase A